MKIQTLKDVKKALKDIPDDVLIKCGAGANSEGGECVQLLIFDTGDDDVRHEAWDKYPVLTDINRWIENIGKEAIKCDADDDSVYEREEPISSEE